MDYWSSGDFLKVRKLRPCRYHHQSDNPLWNRPNFIRQFFSPPQYSILSMKPKILIRPRSDNWIFNFLPSKKADLNELSYLWNSLWFFSVFFLLQITMGEKNFSMVSALFFLLSLTQLRPNIFTSNVISRQVNDRAAVMICPRKIRLKVQM